MGYFSLQIETTVNGSNPPKRTDANWQNSSEWILSKWEYFQFSDFRICSMGCGLNISCCNTLLKYDVTRRDHVSVVMDAGPRIVNFIRDGTVFA